MITDDLLYFSEEQAVTVDAYSTIELDFDNANISGDGRPMYVYVFLDTAFGTTAATLTINLCSGATANPTAVLCEVLPATEADTLEVGQIAKVAIPSGMGQYARLQYDVSAEIADGVITAFIGR